jgi:hypothetical protein
VAVLAARFLPGARVPVYLAAGALGLEAGPFLFWSALAGLVWTPLLVLAAVALGEAAAVPFAYLAGPGWPSLVLSLVALFVLLRLAVLLSSEMGRAKLHASVSLLWRWEFWPTWLFYLPLLPWLAWLSLRYRGPLVWTAANPGIPHGGVVGESKFAILQQLPADSVLASFLLSVEGPAERLERFRQEMRERGWDYPIILKPDASQRGAGVRLVRSEEDAEKYLREHPVDVIVQQYHAGPHEAGIFYYRLPGEERGHIFSVTHKVFPVLTGDGQSTVEELIWRHPRYRMQADTFLRRHEARLGLVLGEGEALPLALAGNHCQGTMFLDGAHLITPELERAVDEAARQFDGFFIGRFDVRYSSTEELRAGRGLAVVELNGVMSESTNIYDPGWSLLEAYATLARQWELLYRIGDANRRRGHRPTSLLELIRLLVDYYGGRQVGPLSD